MAEVRLGGASAWLPRAADFGSGPGLRRVVRPSDHRQRRFAQSSNPLRHCESPTAFGGDST